MGGSIVGIENVETLTEEPIESEEAPVRESARAERERHDAEKAADIKARQVRLGDIPKPNDVEESEDKPKSKSRGRAKKSETEEE